MVKCGGEVETSGENHEPRAILKRHLRPTADDRKAPNFNRVDVE